MVQFSNFCISLSTNISNKTVKRSRLSAGRETAREFVKEAKRNELMLTSSGFVNADKSKSSAVGHSKKGKKGLNQDCFIVWEEFGFQEDIIFCGVFDGHGPWGHLVAKRVRELMPSSLLCNWQEAVALNSLDFDNIITNQFQFDIWKKSYIKTCASVDLELQQHSEYDSFYSGSTALTIIKQGDLMVVANVGDSRAVLATTLNDGNLLATQLTVDLKPNLPDESKRIAQSRGRVYSCPDEPGVHRVWKPKLDGPGLALSRAFGDYFIKDFGLISEPQVTQRTICNRDQFVILATDGVWDVISNQEAVDIVALSGERTQSAKRLVECAVKAWKHKGRAAKMDDISVVCLFFHDHLSDPQPVHNTKLNKWFM
ncbi:hypothetical protein ACJIZ3_014231 [Penstemon smallii]|uniref:PPM-type phosphatase domain-containing protein n=1 Tax=Penstemon smallii TaxID=265156 RepID=A0ABD3RJA0_9LAMI